jgi:hypothetical protein
MSKKINLTPKPNSVWVSCDVDIDIHIEPGSVPNDSDQLFDFSDYLNDFLVREGGTWANYVLFDNKGIPVTSLEYEFEVHEK